MPVIINELEVTVNTPPAPPQAGGGPVASSAPAPAPAPAAEHREVEERWMLYYSRVVAH